MVVVLAEGLVVVLVEGVHVFVKVCIKGGQCDGNAGTCQGLVDWWQGLRGSSDQVGAILIVGLESLGLWSPICTLLLSAMCGCFAQARPPNTGQPGQGRGKPENAPGA